MSRFKVFSHNLECPVIEYGGIQFTSVFVFFRNLFPGAVCLLILDQKLSEVLSIKFRTANMTSIVSKNIVLADEVGAKIGRVQPKAFVLLVFHEISCGFGKELPNLSRIERLGVSNDNQADKC